MKKLFLFIFTFYSLLQAQELNVHFNQRIAYELTGKEETSYIGFFSSENKDYIFINAENLIKNNEISVQTLLNIDETADLKIILNLVNYDAIMASGKEDEVNLIVRNNLKNILESLVEDKGLSNLKLDIKKLDKPQKEFFNKKCNWYAVSPAEKDAPIHLCIAPEKSGIVTPLFNLFGMLGLIIESEDQIPAGLIMEIYNPQNQKPLLQIKELETIDKNFSFKSEFQFK